MKNSDQFPEKGIVPEKSIRYLVRRLFGLDRGPGHQESPAAIAEPRRDTALPVVIFASDSDPDQGWTRL